MLCKLQTVIDAGKGAPSLCSRIAPKEWLCDKHNIRTHRDNGSAVMWWVVLPRPELILAILNLGCIVFSSVSHFTPCHACNWVNVILFVMTSNQVYTHFMLPCTCIFSHCINDGRIQTSLV